MNEILSKLIEAGWKEYEDILDRQSRSFYKRFETPTRCKCNDEKSGMQVCVKVYPAYRKIGISFEIDLAGELPDGTWIKLQNWALPADLDKCLGKIPRLLETWEYIANLEAK